jgi:hypothetical protein
MNAEIPALLQEALEPYREIVNLYSQTKFSEGLIALNNLSIDRADNPNLLLINEFVSLLFNNPILYIKILLTFVFFKTLNKIEETNVIVEFFQNFKENDDENMNKTLGTFYNANGVHDVLNLQETGNLWYTTYFQYLVKNNELTLKTVQSRIRLLVNIANYLMGDNVGTRALESCEIAAHSASSNEYVTFLGCVSELVGPENPACQDPDIKKLIQEFNASLGRGGRM